MSEETVKHPKDITRWATMADARDNGWVAPCEAEKYVRPGLKIIVIDNIGYQSFGCVYAVVDIVRDTTCLRKTHLTSRSLWLYDTRNSIGNLGTFAPAFHVTHLRRCRPSKHAAIAAQTAIVEKLTDELQAEIKKLEELNQ